jgi:hypothetical protein
MMLAAATKSQWGVANLTFQRANVLLELVNVPAVAGGSRRDRFLWVKSKERTLLDEAVSSN